MAHKSLTDRAVRGLETDRDQQTWWDKKLPGFGVRVSGKTGRKSFVVRYRANGTRRRMTLGTYPRTSLADARGEAREVLAAAESGEDPAAEEISPGEEPTGFKAVAERHLEAAVGSRFREERAEEIRRSFEKDVYPAVGDVPVDQLSRRDVAAILEQVVARGAPVQANRLKSMMSGVFEYAFQHELADANPARALRRPATETGRDRVLTPEEIKALWAALEADDSPLHVAVVKLRLLTGQRGREIRYMSHRDLHGDTWTIPADVHKADKRHTVPLTGPALDVLAAVEPRSRGERWVFPSSHRDGPIARPSNLMVRLRERLSFDFQFRDLRRTVATRMADDLQVPRLHIAKVLGHEVPGVTGVYDRASYEAEKRAALERWADRLEEIVEDDGA